MKKIIKDGKVAVLYSSGYGAGWYSWNSHKEGAGKECIFCPEIVEIVEHEDYPTTDMVLEVNRIAEELFGEGFYYGGSRDLQVNWVSEGTAFRIEEYDGAESVEICSEVDWVVA